MYLSIKTKIMTKNEKQNLEALKIGFEMYEWEDFILVLDEIRNRDKEIIDMYRKGCKDVTRLINGCNNAIYELELINGSKEIAVMELKKSLAEK